MAILIRLKTRGLQKLEGLLDISLHYYIVYLTFPLSAAVRGILQGEGAGGFLFVVAASNLSIFQVAIVYLSKRTCSVYTYFNKETKELFNLFCVIQAF